jgi:hypothetical protein
MLQVVLLVHNASIEHRTKVYSICVLPTYFSLYVSNLDTEYEHQQLKMMF